MFHIVRTCKIHKFKHLKQLLKVQILLICNDVEAFVEVVGFLAIIRRGNVASGVQSRAVRFDQKTRRHAVFVEIDNLCAVAFHKQLFLTKYVKARFHFVVVETLACITVKLDSESVVNLADRFHRDRFEHVKVCDCFFVAVLNTLEPSTRFVIHFGMLFRLFVIANVQFVEVIFVVVCNVFERRPLLRRNDEFSELSAPIAEVIYADDVVSEMLEYTIERTADDGRRKVSDMEGFCDIDRTIVNANRLAFSLFACADVLVVCNFDCLFCKRVSVKEDIEITDKEFIADTEQLKIWEKFVCNHGRCKAHRTSKLEARQADIAHFCFFWRFESRFHVLRRKTFNRKRIRYFFFKHNDSFGVVVICKFLFIRLRTKCA